MARVLTVDDLLPHARAALQTTYDERQGRREQCGIVDYGSGWVAALVRYGVYNLFDPEAWAEAHA